jgi:DNA-binding winged helix-turn-helix (wHTH) protein
MQEPVLVRFGPWSLDRGRRQLARDGTEVHLTPKAFDLLAILVAEAPHVVHKSALHERLWPGVFVSDATLVALVKELRRALDDHDPRARVIRTAHRVGYACCASVTRGVERAPAVWHWVAVGGRHVPLGPGEHFIGRDPACGVWLDFGSVSRRHARLVVDDAYAHIGTSRISAARTGRESATSRSTGWFDSMTATASLWAPCCSCIARRHRGCRPRRAARGPDRGSASWSPRCFGVRLRFPFVE